MRLWREVRASSERVVWHAESFNFVLLGHGASLLTQVVKNLPAIGETWV